MVRRSMQQYPPNVNGGVDMPSLGPIKLPDQSPRQKSFANDIMARRAILAQATFDRVAQNAKELTISRGEYLEVITFLSSCETNVWFKTL